MVIGVISAFSIGIVISKLCASGYVTKRIYQRFRYSLKTCVFGATLVWSMSLINISYLANVSPDLLIDARFWASLAVLGVLSFNLYVMRRYAIPMAKKRIGVSIFGGLTNDQQNRMIVLGAVSTVSWITMLTVALMHQVAPGIQNFVMAFGIILGSYLLAILFCLLVGSLGGRMIRKRFFARLRARQAQYDQIFYANNVGRYL